MANVKTKVVEWVGDSRGAYLDFEKRLNEELSTLRNDKVINITVDVSESSEGTRYVGVILYQEINE